MLNLKNKNSNNIKKIMEKSEKWSSRLISDVWALDSNVKKANYVTRG